MAKDKTTNAPVTLRRAFFTLLGDVHDELPKDAIAKTVQADNSFAVHAQKAVSVLRGTSADVDILARIVKATVPGYKFPKIVEQFIAA